MKLFVEFTGRYNTNSVNHSTREIGLDLVDSTRKETGVNLPIDLFKPTVEPFYKDVEIGITEEFARRTGLFGDRNKVGVRMVGGALNNFCHLVPELSRHPNTDEITYVSFQYVIDEVGILKAWSKAGFPMDWFDLQEEG
jgi:hypothetical protein